jgi:hypothetical protein
MVLLTSSQVSALITAFVSTKPLIPNSVPKLTNQLVFLFTLALFLSGYTLQQQTVRDLQAAIKPKEVPKQALLYLPPQFGGGSGQAKPSPKEQGRGRTVVEVKQSRGETAKVGKLKSIEQESGESGTMPSKHANLYDLPQKTDHEPMVETEAGKEERPIGRAERRRRIKEELTVGSEEAGFKGYRRRMW